MTTISPTQNSAIGGSVTANTAQAAQPQVGEEFNSFIKLLTAQIRNQDPLAPLDSTQFVEQLATFSTLEQQVGSNSRLDNIAGVMSDLHSVVAADWLGQSVTVESSWIPYSGDPVEFEFDRPDDADRAVLSIRDSDGNTAWTETLDLNDTRFSWDGRTSDGAQANNGMLNQISIDLFRSGNYIGSVAPRVHTVVTEVGSEGGSLIIGTASNLSADIKDVRKSS